MAAPRGNSERIVSLVAALAGKNGLARQRTRWVLVEIGGPAAGPLVKALSDPRARVRWEAAKALTNIHDSSTVPALIAALEDKDDGVAWLVNWSSDFRAVQPPNRMAGLDGSGSHGKL